MAYKDANALICFVRPVPFYEFGSHIFNLAVALALKIEIAVIFVTNSSVHLFAYGECQFAF